MNILGAQVRDMESMSDSIRKLEGNTNSISVQEYQRLSVNNSKYQDFQPPYAYRKSGFKLSSARPLYPPASVEPSVAPYREVTFFSNFIFLVNMQIQLYSF